MSSSSLNLTLLKSSLENVFLYFLPVSSSINPIIFFESDVFFGFLSFISLFLTNTFVINFSVFSLSSFSFPKSNIVEVVSLLINSFFSSIIFLVKNFSDKDKVLFTDVVPA